MRLNLARLLVLLWRILQQFFDQPAQTELVDIFGQLTVGFTQVIAGIAVAVTAQAFRFVEVQLRWDTDAERKIVEEIRNFHLCTRNKW